MPYLLGIATGFIAILLCGGLLTEFLTKNYAAISPWLRWVGVAYMGWLAVSLFLPHAKKAAKGGPGGLFRSGFRDSYPAGIVLQFVNPKGLLYAVTIYGSFSSILSGSLARTLISAAVLAGICFAAISLWCLVGSSLARLFDKAAFKLGFNIVMAILLVYSAVSIALH